ncbi:MAG TPA: oligoendopeptidase F, partial [Sulfurospirillum sp. UBA11407]
MNWDLSALYKSQTELEADVEAVKQKAKSFESICKNRLKLLSPTEFLEVLREYESISQTLGKFMTYAFL